MRIHIVTVGEPKLAYAKIGWDEYLKRLGRYHDVRTTHVADKHNDAKHLLDAMSGSYKIGLTIDGTQMSSAELAQYLDKKALLGKELSFVIGGPEGLPEAVVGQLDFSWSLSKLTFPHDLAMLTTLEALYRASTILAGHPYHK